jgi:DNA-binding MarR family transcriptional regulator
MKQTKVVNKGADDLLKAMLVFSRTVDHVLETRAVEAAAGPMSRSRVQVLSLLVFKRVETATEIALCLGVTKPAVTQIIDSMERDGLVRRSPGREDRRETHLVLTPKGQRAIRAVRNEQRHLVRNAVRQTPRGLATKWVAALQAVTEALAGADRAFEQFCLQCAAHTDGSCVLGGGEGPCQFLEHTEKLGKAAKKRTK